MISEKTVELNLTTELVNYMYTVTKIRPYILAPSQSQEGTCGFDTSIGYPSIGRPYLLQYKRAEYRSQRNEYLYHLNRTSKQDQHLRLYALELKGWDVFYALPLFHTPTQVINERQHLLPKTLYLKPSWMIPVGGVPAMVGHHEVRYNVSTGVITIHSDEGNEINQSFDFFDLARQLNNKYSDQDEGLVSRFLNDFNSVFSNQETFEVDNFTIEPSKENIGDIFSGMSVIVA